MSPNGTHAWMIVRPAGASACHVAVLPSATVLSTPVMIVSPSASASFPGHVPGVLIPNTAEWLNTPLPPGVYAPQAQTHSTFASAAAAVTSCEPIRPVTRRAVAATVLRKRLTSMGWFSLGGLRPMDR